MRAIHAIPTRALMIEGVRTLGAKMLYGPTWMFSDTETIALLDTLSDSEYVTRCGCDDHDEYGKCPGHDDEATA